LPATNAKRLRKGARDKIAKQFCAEATKQSILSLLSENGLLRFARNDGNRQRCAKTLRRLPADFGGSFLNINSQASIA